MLSFIFKEDLVGTEHLIMAEWSGLLLLNRGFQGVQGVFGSPGEQHDIFVAAMNVFQHCLSLPWSGLWEG